MSTQCFYNEKQLYITYNAVHMYIFSTHCFSVSAGNRTVPHKQSII